MKKNFLLGFKVFIFLVLFLLVMACGKAADEWIIASNTTKMVDATTQLGKLTIEDNATLTAPDGYILTLTVNGVETGQVLEAWDSKNYKFSPGTYEGDIVVTVAEMNDVSRVMTGGRGGAMPEGGMPEGAIPGAAGGREGGMPEGGMPGAAGGGREGGMPEGGMPGGAGGGREGGMPEGGMPGAAGGREGGMPEGAMPEGGMPGAAGGRGGGADAAYAFRQALYLDKDGIDYGKSVLAAVQGEEPTGFDIENIKIESNGSLYKDPTSPGGTGFTGIYAAGGQYNIKNVEIDFFGDGLSDFIGYGAGIVAGGEDTRLVIDNLTIKNHGVVRAGVIAKDGSKVIVKNSDIRCKDGILPPDDPWGQSGGMRSTLWISGMTGNVRATSVLGANTQAAYINSYISSDGWGVLSTDGTNNVHLTAINCTVAHTGPEGYGSYNDPSAHVAYYGTEFDIATFASAIGSGDVYYGDSTPEAVAAINDKLGLGLTAEELKSIPNKATVINSKKYGVMWHARSGNPLTIDGGTTFNTPKTTFIVAGVAAVLNIDGAKGVKINTGSGVIMQVMSDDEPPGMMGQGNTPYEEPTTAPQPIAGFDNTSTEDAATANLSNINLKGDFYNSVGWGKLTDKLNMALNLNNASITGVISASESHHPSPKITIDNQRDFHSITDTARPVVNNGVIVNLTNGSNWAVTGTSYLSKLVLDASSSVTGRGGAGVSMTVNGAKTDIKQGNTYTGAIVVSVE